MKKWEAPAVETLEISDTTWTTIVGTVEDLMYQDCEKLYIS